MDEQVNKLLGKITQLGYEITKEGQLKNKGTKKTISTESFFTKNSINLETTFPYLVETIKSYVEEKEENPEAIIDVFKSCHFVIDRFRWFITKDEICLYYVKRNMEKEEYKYLTNDELSKKFYNCIPIEEKEHLKKVIKEYNKEENPKKRPIQSAKKLIQQFISEIDETRKFRLQEQPIPLTNNPSVAATKFIDIWGIEAWGDECIHTGNLGPLATPAFDRFCERIREQALVPYFKAYIAGLGIDYNVTKQALYIYGNGDDGKSKVIDAIRSFFGEEILFNLPQSMKGNQFTMLDAYGKRIFIGDELQSPNVIKNGMLHAILGGSTVRLEPKKEASFFAKIYACGVITSNHSPLIDNVKNQISRILLIEMNPPSEDEINYQGASWAQALITEFKAFIYKGFKLFKELNPSGAGFRMPPCYADAISDLFDDKAERIKEYIDNVFYFDQGSTIRRRLGVNFREYVKVNYEANLKGGDIPNNYFDKKIDKEIFERLLIKFPDIKKSETTRNGKNIKIFKGLAISHEHNAISMDFDLDGNTL
jgi:hypothetical protein